MEEKILDNIQSPEDLKKLPEEQLPQLAKEIRERLIEVVSQTGGHLAASLGVVELSIALHRVFNSPWDKIIWDVGHQAYAHKLLTGRREEFSTLRQLDGVCGFPRRDESPHDAFNTGHGSTSIAAALGMAQARNLGGSKERIIAVIGDGALTGGLALEALNYAGHLKSNLIIILNDNEMSISGSVGAIASYLSRIRLDPHYIHARDNFDRLLGRLPRGASALEGLRRFKGGLLHLILPGMFFEELGFAYHGPINGHDLRALLDILEHAKDQPGPLFIHVLTRKGKGYAPAENDATRYHGIGAFDIETGEPLSASSERSYTAVFGDTLVKLAEQDSRILAITAAMCSGTGLEKFAKRFSSPKRYFDVGMAEQTAVTFAAGLAAQGFKPVVAIYSTFLQRSYDQILHDVCLQKLPVVLALDRAGLVGEDGPTHHGAFDLSYLRHLPNLTIMAPSDLAELAAMLATALKLGAPAAVRYPREEGENLPADLPEILEVGRGRLLREGEDIALIAVGSMVSRSMAAAEILSERGIEAAVFNARFVKPLDEQAIESLARSCGRLVTIEENALAGGFGGAVAEYLTDKGLGSVPMLRLGLPDVFIEHGPREALLKKLGLEAEGIAEQVAAFVSTAPAEKNYARTAAGRGSNDVSQG
jgi:1-deoxy-D-xylulose-5-phosphate synthase